MAILATRIPANFTAAYTPSLPIVANFVVDNTQYLSPDTIEAGIVATPVVTNVAQGLFPASLVTPLVPSPYVDLKNRVILPMGFAYEYISNPRVQPVQKAFAVGIAPIGVATPYAVVTAFYRSPSANVVVANFKDAYTPQNGLSLYGDFLSTNTFFAVFPVAIPSTNQFGTPAAIHALSPSGIAPSGVGTPSLYSYAYISQSGSDYSVLGTPDVKHVSFIYTFSIYEGGMGSPTLTTIARITVPGSNSEAYGTPAVTGINYVSPTPIYDGDLGTPAVHSFAYILPTGFDTSAIGTPELSIARHLFPESFQTDAYGTPSVSSIYYVAPLGSDFQVSGTPSVKGISHLLPIGILEDGYGTPSFYSVYNTHATGWNSQAFGTASFYGYAYITSIGFISEAAGEHWIAHKKDWEYLEVRVQSRTGLIIVTRTIPTTTVPHVLL